MQQQSIMQTTK